MRLPPSTSLSYAIMRETPMLRRHQRLRHAMDIPLILQPIADQVRHRHHLQPVLLAELHQVRNPRHRAVLVHDLADHTRGLSPAMRDRSTTAFGLPRPHQHTAVARAQRKHVPGPARSSALELRIGHHVLMVWARSAADPLVTPWRASTEISKRGTQSGRFSVTSSAPAEIVPRLLRERQTDQSTAILRHEVDGLRVTFSAAS